MTTITVANVGEAIAQIQPHHRVLLPPACGVPQALVAELTRQAARFESLEICGGFLLYTPGFLEPSLSAHFRHITWHPTGEAARAVNEGRASYVPLRYADTLRCFAPGAPLAIDVLLVQVAPADGHGRYSLGVSPSYPAPVAKQVPLVIAQVNPQMPRTLGNGFLSESDIDVLVEFDEPVLEYRTAPVGEVERRIGAHAARLIPDGATLQSGLGAIPEALLGQLTDKRDLRLYALMVPAAQKLMEAGAVRSGPAGTAICEIMGDRGLFDFVHENRDVHMEHSGYVHAPATIASQPNFVSVLSAIEVDLSGQVNAEALGARAISGIGGHLDFAMGAAMSPDAVRILALPSTGGWDGQHSRIVARIDGGSPVTTPRALVRYVITEHGVADLWGKSLAQRSRALIDIADPRFREPLSRSAATA